MKALCLFSPGIDSPVAASVALSQDLEIGCLHFDNYSGKNKSSLETVRKLVACLEFNHKKKISLKIIDYEKYQLAIKAKCNSRFHCIICKRGMYRLAEQIALKEGYDYLLTGENLGQVASQTLSNLKVLDDAVIIPVLRPLLSYDKQEIITKAKGIGSYKISISYKSGCPFVPSSPATRSDEKRIIDEEKKLD